MYHWEYGDPDWHETTLEEIEQERKIYTCNHERTQEKELEKATCSESGSKLKICLDCGFEEESTLDSLGHNYKNKICTVCGEEKPKQTADIEADTWYVYTNLDILKIQNTAVSRALPAGDMIIVDHYPVCKKCHVVYDGIFHTAYPKPGKDVSELYVCSECGATTYVKLAIIE